jgi:predicted GIY-YIG superfamily endonuclease
MPIDFTFRREALKTLTREIGVYVLCDLDHVPIYVGQSTDGIRQRVQRHMTSARSDIIANRQVDVWEIASVRAYPVASKAEIDELEARLFNAFHGISKLFNGSRPRGVAGPLPAPEPFQTVQVLSLAEIEARRDPAQRLPRQAAHYASIVGHFVAVKNSEEIANAMEAHFERLQRYQKLLLRAAEPE